MLMSHRMLYSHPPPLWGSPPMLMSHRMLCSHPPFQGGPPMPGCAGSGGGGRFSSLLYEAKTWDFWALWWNTGD